MGNLDDCAVLAACRESPPSGSGRMQWCPQEQGSKGQHPCNSWLASIHQSCSPFLATGPCIHPSLRTPPPISSSLLLSSTCEQSWEISFLMLLYPEEGSKPSFQPFLPSRPFVPIQASWKPAGCLISRSDSTVPTLPSRLHPSWDIPYPCLGPAIHTGMPVRNLVIQLPSLTPLHAQTPSKAGTSHHPAHTGCAPPCPSLHPYLATWLSPRPQNYSKSSTTGLPGPHP